MAAYGAGGAAPARGLAVTDDVAFGELDRFAVRVRDNQIQLFGLLLEGWQSLAEGRPVNAKFRAVQVLKLADESITYMARKRFAAGARGVSAQYVAGIGSRRGGAARY